MRLKQQTKAGLPADANIHAREYQLYLPSKEELQQKLIGWVREQEAKYAVEDVLQAA